MKKFAFTLAEVLITLGIIGIVAQMTIPTLVMGYQKQVAVVGFKKFYTEMSRVIKLAEIDNGPSSSWTWIETADLSLTTLFANSYLYPYLNISKKCAQGESGCWTEPASLSGNKGYLRIGITNSLSFVTTNGYSVLFWGGINPHHAQLWVDINGPNKGPAVIGKDVFNVTFWFEQNSYSRMGTFPVGMGAMTPLTRTQLISSTSWGCSKTGVSPAMYSGVFCGALIINDDWDIKDDYPW